MDNETSGIQWRKEQRNYHSTRLTEYHGLVVCSRSKEIFIPYACACIHSFRKESTKLSLSRALWTFFHTTNNMNSNGIMRASLRMGRSLLRGPKALGGTRLLNVHEYVSMDIMRGFNIPVPKGGMATSVAEAEQVYKNVIGEGNDCVIKSMVLTGGRGLGHFSNGFKGGVHLCSKPGDVSRIAAKMLGSNLITKQTTAEGMPCSKVMLVERMYMRREMYISIMLDRGAGGPIFIASPAGGTSIEDVAAATPELIFKQAIDITVGIQDEQSTFLATSLGFIPGTKPHAECKSVVEKLYKMFRQHDCTLVEVNPLAETPDGRVVVCDAKINFDDNAEFRQKDVFAFRDRSQEDPREVEAAKYDLNYIGLTGNVGCMVNGAGLAMATMDILKLKGGDPANFLDVGGGATESQVQKAFELLNADKKVKCILGKIFT